MTKVNKYEDALEWFESVTPFYDDEEEAIIIAIECIKKQIPKKPSKGREFGFEWDECPVCECEIDKWDEDEMYGNLFCPHCSQAIDWSDEDDNN